MKDNVEYLSEEYIKYVDCMLPENHYATFAMVSSVGAKFTVEGIEYRLTVRMDTGKHNEPLYRFGKVAL